MWAESLALLDAQNFQWYHLPRKTENSSHRQDPLPMPTAISPPCCFHRPLLIHIPSNLVQSSKVARNQNDSWKEGEQPVNMKNHSWKSGLTTESLEESWRNRHHHSKSPLYHNSRREARTIAWIVQVYTSPHPSAHGFENPLTTLWGRNYATFELHVVSYYYGYLPVRTGTRYAPTGTNIGL